MRSFHKGQRVTRRRDGLGHKAGTYGTILGPGDHENFYQVQVENGGVEAWKWPCFSAVVPQMVKTA